MGRHVAFGPGADVPLLRFLSEPPKEARYAINSFPVGRHFANLILISLSRPFFLATDAPRSRSDMHRKHTLPLADRFAGS